MSMKEMKIVGLAAVALAVLSNVGLHAAETAPGVTRIEITDQVLVKDTQPLGINLGDDNGWSRCFLKKRVAENFEGTIYRQAHWGPPVEETGNEIRSYWWLSVNERLKKILLEHGTYTILSGPDIWQTGKLKGIEPRPNPDPKKTNPIGAFILDRPVRPGTDGGMGTGILVEADCSQLAVEWPPSDEAEAKKRAESQSPECRTVIGDVPAGSYGNAALQVPSGRFTRFVVAYQRRYDMSGEWQVQFWAKSTAGSPKIALDIMGNTTSVTPTTEWIKYRAVIDVKNINPVGVLMIKAENGDILIDDVECWQEGKDRNPTPFRDSWIKIIDTRNESFN